MEAPPSDLSSRATPRDLLCAYTPNEGPTSELANPFRNLLGAMRERSRSFMTEEQRSIRTKLDTKTEMRQMK